MLHLPEHYFVAMFNSVTSKSMSASDIGIPREIVKVEYLVIILG